MAEFQATPEDLLAGASVTYDVIIPAALMHRDASDRPQPPILLCSCVP
jgi:hypothetical protein